MDKPSVSVTGATEKIMARKISERIVSLTEQSQPLRATPSAHRKAFSERGYRCICAQNAPGTFYVR